MNGRRGVIGLVVAFLGCKETFEVDPFRGDPLAVLGVMRVDPEWTPGAENIESCTGSFGEAVHGAPIILDTQLWTELGLPLMVRNGGPERAEGSRYFDFARTPTGNGISYWICAPEPNTSLSPDPPFPFDGGGEDVFDDDAAWDDGDGSVRSTDAWGEADVDGGQSGDADTSGGSRFAAPTTELVLHRRDPSRSFCLARLPSEPWNEGPGVQAISASGETIYGGQLGLVVSEAIPHALGADLDFELELAELARACCRESGDETCAPPLSGASCEALAGRLRSVSSTATAAGRPELGEPLDVYAARLVSRPTTLWMQLNLEFEFEGPYGNGYPEYVRYWLRMGFCRGCGGKQPREAGRPDPVLECLARRTWESP